MKVLNNTIHPKAILHRVPENPKSRVCSMCHVVSSCLGFVPCVSCGVQSRLRVPSGRFALRLLLSVENGDLIYRSNGHFWQCGNWVLNIPDYLLLGTASISEHALSDEEFYLDFTIQHPWWGETYSYRGSFRYC